MSGNKVEQHTDPSDNYKLLGTCEMPGSINMSGTFQIGGTTVTSTAAELNILDGVTSTAAELNILDGVTATAAELNIMDGVTATAVEINQLCDNSARFQAGGSSLSLTVASHAGKIIQLDTATGTTITLPAATGTGAVFKFLVTTLATSNSHVIQTSAGTEHMQGIIQTMDDTSDNVQAFAAVSGTSDTITLNRSTTGSVTLGEVITLTDVASTLWLVEGSITNTGTAATPFSAAV